MALPNPQMAVNKISMGNLETPLKNPTNLSSEMVNTSLDSHSRKLQWTPPLNDIKMQVG